MGCLSSRSTTTVSPIDSSASSSTRQKQNSTFTPTSKNINSSKAGEQRNGYISTDGGQLQPKDNYSDSGTERRAEMEQKQLVDIGTSLDNAEIQSSLNHSFAGADQHIMSILMTERDKSVDEELSSTTGDAQRANSDNRDRLRQGENGLEDSNNGEINRTNNIGYKMQTREGDTAAPIGEGSNVINLAANMRQRDKTFDEGFGARQNQAVASRADNRPDGDGGDDLASASQLERERNGDEEEGNNIVALPNQENRIRSTTTDEGSRESSFDEELNVDLLRQYIAVDFEIGQLEDRDALRLYHEKIEQLEQLERELDMISFETEEMAVRSETGLSQLDRAHSPDVISRPDSKLGDLESNSIMSGAFGSMSPRSSITRQQNNQSSNKGGIKNGPSRGRAQRQQMQQIEEHKGKPQQDEKSRYLKETNSSYSTIEDVFNRKIILEKERDKLKKEVEMVITECDRLQQRYKKRDEILDKLFDGRTGNGLENHLEQQLAWLMEQKHYVDQVFYAWKRAETLTSQTCEQFARALELLKRLPKVQDNEQRHELAKNICNLLTKSRQDMEQAQRYNPNVDAPFFTDAETERFDWIIETVQSSPISQNDYNQMATVVQFAYKRAVSIRLWLEQILQITIARDSFELAEEYKWIAIQLRKERISLINTRLQDAPYRAMAQQVRDQLARQQPLQNRNQTLAITDGKAGGDSNQDTNTNLANNGSENRNKNEVNRDSGVESDDIDIEEDIYRVLEMNKGILEAVSAASKEAGLPQAFALDSNGRPLMSQPNTPAKGPLSIQNQLLLNHQKQQQSASVGSSSQRDQMMRERIQRRVQGEQRLNSSVVPLASVLRSAGHAMKLSQEWRNSDDSQPAGTKNPSALHRADQMKRETTNSSRHQIGTNQQPQRQQSAAVGLPQNDGQPVSSTPPKLQIQLDEASKQNLLKQVDQIHTEHRNRLDNLRGNNKAKASDFLMSKMQNSQSG